MRSSALRIATRMLRSGASCSTVAQRLGCHRSTIYRLRLAVGLPRRWFPLTDTERRSICEMLLQDLSRREVARKTRRGLGTVSRVGTSLAGQPTVKRVRRPYRCPGCGIKIVVTPCLICASGGAEDAIAKARQVA